MKTEYKFTVDYGTFSRVVFAEDKKAAVSGLTWLNDNGYRPETVTCEREMFRTDLLCILLVEGMSMIGGPGAPSEARMHEMAEDMVQRSVVSEEVLSQAERAHKRGILRGIGQGKHLVMSDGWGSHRKKALVEARYARLDEWYMKTYSEEIG